MSRDPIIDDLLKPPVRKPFPTDPVEIARLALELVEKATRGPWHACHNGECTCKQVWCDDHPVAVVEAGPWGDEFPALRLTGGHFEQKVEAYMERYEYGSISENAARANAQLIAFARSALPILAQAVLAAVTSDQATK